MTIFYVDMPTPGGAPGLWDGHSPATPLQGLDKVSELMLGAGDVVALRAGAVFELGAGKGSFVISVGGAAGAPVRFTRYGAGDNPLIKAGGDVGMDMLASRFVKVDSIDVEGGKRAAVRMDAKSHHITFENMNVSNAGFGFEILGSNSLFSHNSVHDLRMIVNTPGGDDDYGAVAFAIQGNDNEFSFNRVWRAKAASFDYGADGGGFEFWGSVKRVAIHHNWVEESAGFVEAGGQGAQDELADIEIFNNVSYKNDLFQWIHNAPETGKFGLTLKGLNVHHNTIIEPSAKQVVGFDGAVKPGSFTFARNLVVAPLAKAFNQPGDYHVDNFYEVGAKVAGSGERFGTVRFVDGGGRTFRVLRGEQAESYGAYGLGSGPIDFAERGRQSLR